MRLKVIELFAGVMGCLTATGYKDPPKIYDNYKIRRLTPLECFRLMGFSDTDFINAQKTISDSQLYKQVGNSIVVNVLEAIFKNLFLEEETPVIQKLF